MSEFDGVAEEIDDMPASLKEGTEDDDIEIQGEDISGAETMEFSDVVEPAKGVEMYIKGAPTIDTYTRTGDADWFKRSLRVALVVGPKGIDGKGKYKNKHFFPRDILIQVNREAFPDSFSSEGYTPKTGSKFGPYKDFLTALGFKADGSQKNDKAFRKSLDGRKLLVDITKEHRRAFDEQKKKWVNTDEFENKLYYRGQPKAAPQAEVAEAAAS